jgi:hypothetical protein
MKALALRPASSPLASLNAHIAQTSSTAREALGDGANGSLEPWPELRSARQFRETWERLRAEQQVQQAQASAPPNAGPLNPERLVIDTLARMGERSPHYLRRFLAHTETLMWLEQAQGYLKLQTGKGGSSGPAKPARKNK